MDTATDPLTGEVFYKQRSNQKFASRENQIRYNNKIAEEKRRIKASIDKKLDKNRTILKNILRNQTEVIKSIDFLHGAGFDFFIHTHNYIKGQQKFSCVYEFAFGIVEKGKIKIFRYGN